MNFVQWWHYLPLKQFKRKIRAILQTRQQETEQTGKDKEGNGDTKKPHQDNRRTGSQDNTTTGNTEQNGRARRLL